jgi:hypothetical protein
MLKSPPPPAPPKLSRQVVRRNQRKTLKRAMALEKAKAIKTRNRTPGGL